MVRKKQESKNYSFRSVQSLSPVQLLATPWTAACQASLSSNNSLILHKLLSTESVMPSNHLILRWPLPFLPSVLPSIWVFSNESVLPIRWPNYWTFSFSTSPSNESSGLISLWQVVHSRSIHLTLPPFLSTALSPACTWTLRSKLDYPAFTGVGLLAGCLLSPRM